MITKKNALFILAAILYCLSILAGPYPGHWLLKLVPVALLLFYKLKLSSNKNQQYFLAGLVFSLLGDFLLGFDANNWFIFGLGAFFIAHICYILALKPIQFGQPVAVCVYLLSGALIFWLLQPGLGELLLPVFAYMLILLLMAITTLLSKRSNRWMVIGGLSFVLSDTLIGLNKFYLPLPQAQLLIMISYYFAQFALVQGFFSKQNQDNNTELEGLIAK